MGKDDARQLTDRHGHLGLILSGNGDQPGAEREPRRALGDLDEAVGSHGRGSRTASAAAGLDLTEIRDGDFIRCWGDQFGCADPKIVASPVTLVPLASVVVLDQQHTVL